jgi:hypothetical protein
MAAQSLRQVSRFPRCIAADEVFGTHGFYRPHSIKSYGTPIRAFSAKNPTKNSSVSRKGLGFKAPSVILRMEALVALA